MPRSEAKTPDPTDVAVGGRIKAIRETLRVSQTELATPIGVTFQQVQKYEKGTNRVSASMLARIAAKLGTTVGDLLGEEKAETHLQHGMSLSLLVPGAPELLEGYAVLTREQQEAVLRIVMALAEAQRSGRGGRGRIE